MNTKAQALKKLAALGWLAVPAPAGQGKPGRSYSYLQYPNSAQVGYFHPVDLLQELTK